MNYADGSPIQPGNLARIDGQYQGRVVASMDSSRYLAGHESWAYLGTGIMIDTNFGGLVHYTEAATDTLELLSRTGS